MNRRTQHHPAWTELRETLGRALAELGAPTPREPIGDIRFLSEGLTYRVFYAHCRIPTNEGTVTRPLVVRYPGPDAGPDQPAAAQRERALLDCLAEQRLAIKHPRILALVPVSTGLAVVETAVDGIPVDLRSGRMEGVVPWQVVAEAAACCHQVDTSTVLGLLTGHATRREHGLAVACQLESSAIPEASAAAGWVRGHLPPDEPSGLLHGDLLGQNLLLSLEPEKQLGVIDWHEAQLGDPAYDLAVVTRGARKPFQAPGGLASLLEAYASRSTRIVTRAQVYLFELGLHAGFCDQACRAYGAGSPGELNARQAFLSVLERASRVRGT